MRTGLDHLPEKKQREIHRALDVLADFEETEMVILFNPRWRRHYADNSLGLDLCVIATNQRQVRRIEDSGVLREKLQDACGSSVSLLVRSVHQFNSALEDGEYFYVDLIKEGVLLVDSGTSSLRQPLALTPRARLRKAREDYAFWTAKGNDFLRSFRQEIIKQHWRSAAIHIHQAAENHLTAACLVLSGFRPKGLDVVELETWCAQRSPEFGNAFPRNTDEDRRLLALLRFTNTEMRDGNSPEVSREDLAGLSSCILKLVDCVRRLGESIN